MTMNTPATVRHSSLKLGSARLAGSTLSPGFRRFMELIDRGFPADPTAHLMVDSYITDQAEEIRVRFLRQRNALLC